MNQIESPKNFQTKCLCVLVLDVSGSMIRPTSPDSSVSRLDKLNEGVATFYDDILKSHGGVTQNVKNQVEVAIIKFDQEPTLVRRPHLLESKDKAPVLTERGSTTETVLALDAAINLIAERKEYYKLTGQTYYRPWIVLITDGNPTCSEEDIDKMANMLKTMMKRKKFNIIGVSVVDQVD